MKSTPVPLSDYIIATSVKTLFLTGSDYFMFLVDNFVTFMKIEKSMTLSFFPKPNFNF